MPHCGVSYFLQHNEENQMTTKSTTTTTVSTIKGDGYATYAKDANAIFELSPIDDIIIAVDNNPNDFNGGGANEGIWRGVTKIKSAAGLPYSISYATIAFGNGGEYDNEIIIDPIASPSTPIPNTSVYSNIFSTINFGLLSLSKNGDWSSTRLRLQRTDGLNSTDSGIFYIGTYNINLFQDKKDENNFNLVWDYNFKKFVMGS